MRTAPPPDPGERVRSFRHRHHPDLPDEQWDDWHWQLRHRYRDARGLARILRLTEEEASAIDRIGGRLPVGITPYYAALIDPADPLDPIRRTMVPVSGEFVRGPGEAEDPLGEDGHTVVPGLVHRYPDRVLFLVTNFCATYCRYCTRARLVGHTGEYHFTKSQYERAFEYIRRHEEIRDVLISGGDPLTMSDERIEEFLARLRSIPHVELVRIGSKVPMVLPQRITPDLVRMLERYHPLWLSIHVMHPNELTPEAARACSLLAGAGIPLGSQTVLTKGVNDDVETMRRLVHGLLRIRVRPYYLYQCDPISGSAHLRTPIRRGLEIVRGLRGFTTGYAVPQFVVDAPGGGGKIPLQPEALVGRDGDDVLLRNFQDGIFRYYDPEES